MKFSQIVVMIILPFLVGLVFGYLTRRREEYIKNAIIYFDKEHNILGITADGKEVEHVEFNVVNKTQKDEINLYDKINKD